MSSLIGGQRAYSSAAEHCSWCIAGKSFLGHAHSTLPSQRLAAVVCLRSSRQSQNASISSNFKSTELFTSKAALIEPDTELPSASIDLQICYLQDLVSKLRQIENYSAKVAAFPAIFLNFCAIAPATSLFHSFVTY
jgi:hypothetical protein